MRAHEFINEDDENDYDDYRKPELGFSRTQTKDDDVIENSELVAMANNIRSKCRPFIQQNKELLQDGYFLYRGVRGADYKTDFAIEGTVRADRRPKDTAMQWHTAADDYFRKEFNWKYRSASLFAATDRDSVVDYGSSYIVFPEGNYEMCYSPKITDFTLDVTNGNNAVALAMMLRNMSDDEVINIGAKYNLGFQTKEDIKAAMSCFRYMTCSFLSDHMKPYTSDPSFNSNIRRFIVDYFMPRLGYTETQSYAEVGDSEVMIRCSKYFGVLASNKMNITYKRASMALLEMIVE